MPANEKEINCNLFDKLELVERIEMAAKGGSIENVLKQIELEKRWIERKLYQSPPLNNDQG